MNQDADKKEHYLFPGNLFASTEPYVVTTVLGSCVSVCLIDESAGIGGINHYMLPLWNGEGLASPKYGNIAIEKLLEKVLQLGANRSRLKAKVFGGGEVLKISNGVLNVGERNIKLAEDMLHDMRIHVAGKDVGGQTGRKLLFNTSTGKVLMKRLNKQVDDIRI